MTKGTGPCKEKDMEEILTIIFLKFRIYPKALHKLSNASNKTIQCVNLRNSTPYQKPKLRHPSLRKATCHSANPHEVPIERE